MEHAEIYELFGEDLRRIEEEGSRIGTHLQFATAWLPLAIGLTATLATVTIPKDRVFEGILLVTLVGYGLGLFHGVCAWRQRGRFIGIITEIRDRKVGPMGQEGHELKPADLEKLESVEPPAAPRDGGAQ